MDIRHTWPLVIVEVTFVISLTPNTISVKFIISPASFYKTKTKENHAKQHQWRLLLQLLYSPFPFPFLTDQALPYLLFFFANLAWTVFYSLQPNVGSLFSPRNTLSHVKSGSSTACHEVKFPVRNVLPSNVSSSSSSLFFSGSLRFASLTTSSPKKSRVLSSVRASAEVWGFAGFYFSLFFPGCSMYLVYCVDLSVQSIEGIVCLRPVYCVPFRF